MDAFTFQLGQKEDPGTGLGRIVLEQIELAAGLVGHPAPTEDDVHEYRRACRRVRSVLRLVRELDEAFYRAENARFRDAARMVSPMRRTTAMTETVQKLVADGTLDGSPAEPLQDYVNGAAAGVRAEILDLRGVLAAVMANAEPRFSAWALPGGLAPTSVGMEDTYARGLRSMDEAYRSPSSRLLHQWRKQVKFLQHQAEVLSGSSSNVGGLAQKLADLSKGLGLHQDIADLSAVVGAAPFLFRTRDRQRTVLRALEHRQTQLRAELEPQGRACFTEAPPQFAVRMMRYWEHWRASS